MIYLKNCAASLYKLFEVSYALKIVKLDLIEITRSDPQST